MNKNYLLSIAAAIIFVTGSVFADNFRSNNYDSNFYMGVQGGPNFFSLNKTYVDKWGYEEDYTMDNADVGYSIGGFVGYRFNQNWRIDVTVDYLDNPDTLVSKKDSSSKIDINWQQLFVLMNGYIDFPVTYNFAPFFGLGFGYSKPSVTPSSQNPNDYKSGLGMQTTIGFNYSMLEDVSLGFAYRLLVANTQHYSEKDKDYESCYIANSVLSLSLSYTFGD